MGLMEKLKERQGDRSQAVFAKELGIKQPQLSRIYGGSRNLTIEVARKIRQQYPELWPDIAVYLLEDDPELTEAVNQ